MEEKMIKGEMDKTQKLLDTAQHKLDSAKKDKAPKDTIKFLEQRVEALENRMKKIKSFNAPSSKSSSVEEQENTTEPKVVKNKGKKDIKEV